MEKYIYDGTTGIWYELQGGGYVPANRRTDRRKTRLF